MRKRLFATAALWLFILPPVQADDPPLRQARVTNVSGLVTIKTDTHSKEPAVIDEETPLEVGDLIETGPKSYAEITLDGETVFILQSLTHVKITKLFVRYTQLDLSRGMVLAKVKPIKEPGQGLILKMPTAIVAVRGTEFAAESEKGLSHVGVFDHGHVAVTGAWGHEHVLVGPHQETSVPLSNVPQPPHSLAHFKTYRKQMAHIRERAAFWRKNWQPVTTFRQQQIRERLYTESRSPSSGFNHVVKKARLRHKRQ